MATHLSDIFAGFGQTIKLCKLLTVWDNIVDERIRKHTQAIKIRQRVLYVAASSATWAQQLTFLKNELINKFNQQAGSEVIRDIRFQSGGF